MVDGPYKGLRGFGATFTAGGCRYWYIDPQGFKRWANDDTLVDEPPVSTTPSTNPAPLAR